MKKGELVRLLIIGIWVAIVLLLCSCKTKYVSVPEYHTEYVSQLRIDTLRDSVYHRDSVFVEVKGDTVFKTKFKMKERVTIRHALRVDTLIKNDSVRVPYPVERALTKKEQFYMSTGKNAIRISGVATLVLLALIAFKKRKFLFNIIKKF